MKNLKNTMMALMVMFGLASCASVEKATLESNNVDSALTEVTNMRDMLKEDHVDLVAHSSYKNGVDHLEEAREDLAEGDDSQEILNDLSMAKAYFLKAKSTAMSKTTSNRILSSRTDAMNSGIMKNEKLTEMFNDTDELFRDETDNFTKSLTPDDFAKIQKKYLELEVKGTQFVNLDWARSTIEKAVSKDADDLAPKTYSDAKADLKAAENKIAQNPKLETYYVSSVTEANNSAALLSAVMDKLTGPAKGSSEEVALTLVKQSDVINAQGGMIAAQGAVIANAASKINFQEAMNRVKDNFSEDEATVYQQGDKLIIRLRDMNFKTGSSTVPTNSYTLLNKIENIVKDLDPTKVEVIGHTDSRGSDSLNQKLSTKRAQAVAEYFSTQGANYAIETKGYGESKPIANNSTAKGRSLNRRVDLVIDVK